MSFNYSISGAVVYWTASKQTQLDTLAAGLDAIGLGRFAPTAQSDSAALKAAMTDLYAGPTQGGGTNLIRPDRQGFSVVTETQGVFGLRHETQVHVTFRHNTLQVTPAEHPDFARILSAVQAQLDLVPTASLTSALTDIVRHLGGVSMRPTGGIYWIPGRSLDKWRAVIAAVQASGASAVYMAQTVADAESVRAVTDAIVAEIEAEVAQVQRDLADGLTPRSGKARSAHLGTLTERLRGYEDALGLTLDSLRDALVQMDHALIAAAGTDDWGGGLAVAAFGGGFD
jgi:hypothetical protein